MMENGMIYLVHQELLGENHQSQCLPDTGRSSEDVLWFDPFSCKRCGEKLCSLSLASSFRLIDDSSISRG